MQLGKEMWAAALDSPSQTLACLRIFRVSATDTVMGARGYCRVQEYLFEGGMYRGKKPDESVRELCRCESGPV